jgi:hypothetical protein
VKHFERRVARLEERLGVKRGPRWLIVTNVDCEGCTHELFPGGPFLDVLGPPLTARELDDLREKYRRNKNTDEQS